MTDHVQAAGAPEHASPDGQTRSLQHHHDSAQASRLEAQLDVANRVAAHERTQREVAERERSRLSEELATIATTLVSAGFRGDDVVKGVEWLARQPLRGRFTEAREEIARLTDVNAKLLREQADWSDRFHDKKERAEAAESELAQARAEIARYQAERLGYEQEADRLTKERVAADASLVRLRAQVGEVIARWRERAVDDPRNRVIGVGILTCADELSALLASLSAPGQETAQEKS